MASTPRRGIKRAISPRRPRRGAGSRRAQKALCCVPTPCIKSRTLLNLAVRCLPTHRGCYRGRAIARQGLYRVAIRTRYTMEQDFYRGRLNSNLRLRPSCRSGGTIGRVSIRPVILTSFWPGHLLTTRRATIIGAGYRTTGCARRAGRYFWLH